MGLPGEHPDPSAAEEVSLEDYPGWFPSHVPPWRRRWVQLVACALVAFVLGTTVNTASTSTTDMVSVAQARSLAARAATHARSQAASGAEKHVLSAPAVVAALATERRQAEATSSARVTRLESQLKAARSATARARAAAQRADAARASAEARAQQARSLATTAGTPAAPSGGTDPRYSTCGEANANGYGPYRQGSDPEYAWYIDRDGDGVDCEP